MGFVMCLWDASVKLMGSKRTAVARICRYGRHLFVMSDNTTQVLGGSRLTLAYMTIM